MVGAHWLVTAGDGSCNQGFAAIGIRCGHPRRHLVRWGDQSSALPAAAPETPHTPPPSHDFHDIHSAAKPEEARVTNVALDLRADFQARRLSGTATLSLEAAPGAREVILDTQDLTIDSVTDASGKSSNTLSRTRNQ